MIPALILSLVFTAVFVAFLHAAETNGRKERADQLADGERGLAGRDGFHGGFE